MQHSERPFAYAVDWLCQRVAGEFIISAMEVMFFIGVTLFVCLFGGFAKMTQPLSTKFGGAKEEIAGFFFGDNSDHVTLRLESGWGYSYGEAGTSDTSRHWACFIRRLFNSFSLFGISGTSGGMLSTECHSSTYAEQVIRYTFVCVSLGKQDNSKVLRRFLLNALAVAAYLLGRTRIS